MFFILLRTYCVPGALVRSQCGNFGHWGSTSWFLRLGQKFNAEDPSLYDIHMALGCTACDPILSKPSRGTHCFSGSPENEWLLTKRQAKANENLPKVATLLKLECRVRFLERKPHSRTIFGPMGTATQHLVRTCQSGRPNWSEETPQVGSNASQKKRGGVALHWNSDLTPDKYFMTSVCTSCYMNYVRPSLTHYSSWWYQ
jgi:hypothetical protein